MTYLLVFLSFWNVSASQTYQIYNGDTINIVDENNMKQGHWIYFGKMKNLPGFGPDQKVEEGPYKNNRKNGEWKKYFPNENTKSKITYVNNRPNGAYEVYYENGQTMIEGNWNLGKEDGEIKEFYANGDVKSIKVFNDGGLDAAKTQTFEPKEEIVEVKELPSADPTKTAPVIDKTDSQLGGAKVVSDGVKKVHIFDGNGFTTLYNKNRQISQKGEFKNGKLMDGQWHRYDENGLKVAIEVYKNGRYVGDAVIAE